MGRVELRAVLAHHEAGHVVADLLGGIVVSRVSVVHQVGGMTDVAGFDETDLRGLDGEALRERLEPAVLGLFAGPFAEEHYTGTFDGDRAAADLNQAAHLGLACLPCDLEWATYEGELTGRARELVDANWGVIQELAAELAMRGEMTTQDLDAFLAGRLPVRGE